MGGVRGRRSILASGCVKVVSRERNHQEEVDNNVQVLLTALKVCSKTRNLESGKKLHAKAVQCGHIYVTNSLMNMYAKCGSMVDARRVFDCLYRPTLVSWNTLILGYAENGQGQTSLDLFRRMLTQGPAPNVLTFVASFKSCASIALEGPNRWAECCANGKEIHKFSIHSGCGSDVYLQSILIDMYAKCGSMLEAYQVFDSMKHRDVVTWNVLILGYADNREGETALDMFTRMKAEGPEPNSMTFVAALKACTSLAVNEGPSRWAECRDRGKELQMKTSGNNDLNLQSTLVDMYSKCGSMVEAYEAFNSIKHPDVVCWNVLVLGYTENGQSRTTLDIFTRMRTAGPAPDSVTCVAGLKACSSLAVEGGSSRWLECREIGEEIHKFAVDNGYDSDVHVQGTLIDMYAKCGSMLHAQKVFDNVKYPTVVSWTALIMGYAYHGQGRTAMDMFSRMKAKGSSPNSVTLVAALKACISIAVEEGASRWAECRDKGRGINSLAFEFLCNDDVYFQNTLLDMYAICGRMLDACEAFGNMKHPTAVSWNVLILGYANNEQGETALELFTSMRIEGIAPNAVTFVAALKACVSIVVKEGASQWWQYKDSGCVIHNLVKEYGCQSDIYVQNSLIDMYAKGGSMEDACEVFDYVKFPDVFSWTALIAGYVQNGQGHAALELFTRMRSEGPAPDSTTLGAALRACGLVAALDFGRTIHSQLDRLDVVLVTCLVDFYCKCGSMEEARSVFDFYSETRDIITWTALMAGFSSCGDSEAVFGLFQRMQDAGFQPDGATFLCILTCCNHAGLVVKGKECFDEMSAKYGIIHTVEHYNCMIDNFGRANKLNDVMYLLECMPCSPNEVTWMTVLGACRKWENVEIGKLAFQALIKLNANNTAGYVLMGQIYESRGMLQEQEMVIGARKLIKDNKQEETCWTNEGEVG